MFPPDDRVPGALVRWVDAHAERFVSTRWPALGPSFEEVEPLGSFAAVLCAMTHPATASPWAARTAAGLGRRVREATAGLDWAAVASAAAAPADLAFVAVEPLLALACGFPPATATPVRAVLAAAAPYGLTGDLALAADLVGLLPRAEAAAVHLAALPTGSPSAWTSSDLYDLTHAVCYATRFGRRPLPVGTPLPPVDDLARARLAAGDADLAAELVLAHRYVGLPERALDDVVAALRAAVRPDGSVAGPPWLGAAPAATWHTTLVCLAALADGRRHPSAEPSDQHEDASRSDLRRPPVARPRRGHDDAARVC